MSKKKSSATRGPSSRPPHSVPRRFWPSSERSAAAATLVVAAGVVGVLALVLVIGYAVQSSRDTTGQVATAPAGVVDEYAVPRGDATRR